MSILTTGQCPTARPGRACWLRTVSIDPQPCPCGRTLKRIGSVNGHSDDLLIIDGVTIHPLQFASLTADPDVREFQVIHRDDRLTLRIVLADAADACDTAARVRDRIAAALQEAGIADPDIEVDLRETIERPASGKLQLVVADPRTRARPAAS